MIRTRDLTMHYGQLCALDKLSLDIGQGEFFAFNTAIAADGGLTRAGLAFNFDCLLGAAHQFVVATEQDQIACPVATTNMAVRLRAEDAALAHQNDAVDRRFGAMA